MIYPVVSFESRSESNVPRVLCVDLSATRKGQGYIGRNASERGEGKKEGEKYRLSSKVVK